MPFNLNKDLRKNFDLHQAQDEESDDDSPFERTLFPSRVAQQSTQQQNSSDESRRNIKLELYNSIRQLLSDHRGQEEPQEADVLKILSKHPQWTHFELTEKIESGCRQILNEISNDLHEDLLQMQRTRIERVERRLQAAKEQFTKTRQQQQNNTMDVGENPECRKIRELFENMKKLQTEYALSVESRQIAQNFKFH